MAGGSQEDTTAIPGVGPFAAAGLAIPDAPGVLREKAYVDEGSLGPVLESLRVALPDTHGLMMLSTCDRIEVFAVAPPAGFKAVVSAFLADRAGVSESVVAPFVHEARGIPALRRLMRIASALESAVVGEPHVLGQVREAHRTAQSAGVSTLALETVLQVVFQAAKRVRNETRLGQHPVSLAQVGTEIARSIHGDLRQRSALLIGVGDMGEVLCERFMLAGLGQLTVAHPVERRAVGLARRLIANHAHWADTIQTVGADAFDGGVLRADILAQADILVASVGTGVMQISHGAAKEALRRRRREPQFLIDAAIPSEIDPDVDRLTEAFLYGLADLERLAREGLRSREQWTSAADGIIQEEIEGFLAAQHANEAGPALGDLRAHLEAIRTSVLEDLGQHSDPSIHAEIAKATRLLINRILHRPAVRLRALAASERRGELATLQTALDRAFAAEDDTVGSNTPPDEGHGKRET